MPTCPLLPNDIDGAYASDDVEINCPSDQLRRACRFIKRESGSGTRSGFGEPSLPRQPSSPPGIPRSKASPGAAEKSLRFGGGEKKF